MSDNRIPMFKWGEFARYKNDDNSTSCYRGQKFIGAFDNNTAFCELFTSFALEVTAKDARIKELEEREKRLVEYFQKAVVSARFFYKYADCRKDSWGCKCDFCKNNQPSIDLNNCDKFLKELGINNE